MQAYKIEATLPTDGTLILSELPFHAGERVEVIIVPCPRPSTERYPLRGQPLHYENPTEPIAETDWEALR